MDADLDDLHVGSIVPIEMEALVKMKMVAYISSGIKV